MSRVLVIGSDTQIAQSIGDALSVAGIPSDYAFGRADALQRLRMRSFSVVITNANSSVEEDLALLDEMRHIRPGVKCIVLAHHSTPEDVIAALRAHVFACFTPPFDAHAIASLAADTTSDNRWQQDIHVLSARPGWVSVRISCRLITAERLLTFAKEFANLLPDSAQLDLMQALREILLNAMEHGADFNPEQVVEVTAIRTARSLVFHVIDPGAGFRQECLTHAAVANPHEDVTAHVRQREDDGMRPGGYGLLLANGTVDELIYSEIGNEVLLIKYLEKSAT